MRSFARALKFSWTYRIRFILSLFCALMVSVFWGLNLSAIGPVLQILGKEQNLHEWVDKIIDEQKVKSNDPIKLEQIDTLQSELAALDRSPDAPDRENVIRRKTLELAELQGQLNEANKVQYRYQLLKSQVIRLLPTNRFETFIYLMLAVVIGTAIKGVFDFFQEVLVGHVVNRTLYDIRNKFFRAAIHQDTRQLADTGTSEMMARFTNDMEQLGQGMKTIYGRLVVEPLKAIACIVGACMISWQLTLVFMILIPLALITLSKVSRMMRRAARKLLERMSAIYQIVRETFEGIRVVKAFTMEPYERRRFRNATDDYARKAQQVNNIDAFAGPLVELLGVATLGLALVAGAYLVMEKQRRIFGLNMSGPELLTPEMLTHLYIFLVAVADPVRKLSSVYTKIQAGEAAAQRIFAVMDIVSTVKANPDGPILPRHAKSIEFKNITFSYQEGTENPTLNQINLSVKAGETIALVGPNGCGKTTLLGLLPRFYDPTHGVVTIDGLNLRAVNLRSVRKQIGLVTQQTVMFEDTIFNNIAYGKPGATAEEVEAAARKAFAHEFVEPLSKGYQTMIGQGWKPSGGQEQRLALARAILRNPSILILDEFTSQIDPESEAKIHSALKDFIKGRTTFLITHRLSTLEMADRIVVLDAGQITAIGTHQSLIASSPLYQRLYDLQLQQQLRMTDAA